MIDTKLLFIKTISPLHIGGPEKGSLIDQPVIKDLRGLPYIPGSSLKGVIKRKAKEKNDLLFLLFGCNIEDLKKLNLENYLNNLKEKFNESIPSSVNILDGIPLFIIARELNYGYVYVTTYFYLKRFFEYLEIKEKSNLFNNDILKNYESNIFVSQTLKDHNLIVNEYELHKSKITSDNVLIEKLKDYLPNEIFKEIKDRLIILPDSDRAYRLIQRSFIVYPRIRLQLDIKIAEEGALWYEEYIPYNCIFVSLIIFNKERIPIDENISLDSLIEVLNNNIISLGGKESIGKGFCKIIFK